MPSNLLKNSFWKVVHIFISNISILILFIVLSRSWNPGQYGTYLLFYSIIFFFNFYILNGLGESTSKHIAESLEKKDKNTTTIITASLSITLFISLLLAFALIIIKKLFLGYFFEEELLDLLNLAPAYIFLTNINGIIENILKGFRALKHSTLLHILFRSIQIALMALLIYLAILDEKNMIIVTVLALLVSVLLGIIIIKIKYFSIGDFFKKNIYDIGKNIFIYAIPISITGVTYYLYTRIDILIIGLYYNNAEVAYYNVADKIFQIPYSIIFVFMSSVFAPIITSYYIAKKFYKLQELLTKLFTISLIIIIPTTIILFFGSDWLIKTVFPQYTESILLLKILTPLLLIKIISIINIFLIATNYAKYTNIIVITGAVLNITFDFLLVPLYGSVGAIIVTIIVQIVISLMQIYLIHRKLNLKIIINLKPGYLFNVIKQEIKQ